MFKSIPLGSPIHLVYNIKLLGLLVLLVYNMNNRSMSSMIKCHILTNTISTCKSPMANHGHSLVQCRIVTTIVSMFKSIPLGSPIPLVYNIKPLGLIVLLVYCVERRSTA